MFEVLCVTWWRNWFLRNEATYSAAPRLPSDVVQWAASYLQDFKATKVVSAISSTRPVKDFKWHLPATCFVLASCAQENFYFLLDSPQSIFIQVTATHESRLATHGNHIQN
ncbi:hypothetical protein ACOSP7_007958 [Xanthoceras sorbifolium]